MLMSHKMFQFSTSQLSKEYYLKWYWFVHDLVEAGIARFRYLQLGNQLVSCEIISNGIYEHCELKMGGVLSQSAHKISNISRISAVIRSKLHKIHREVVWNPDFKKKVCAHGHLFILICINLFVHIESLKSLQ